MNLNYTETQESIRQMIRTFAEKEIAAVVADMENTNQFPHDLVRKMGANGLLGIPIPKEWGGLGADFLSYMLAIEEISKVSAAVGVILAVHTSVGTYPILYYGSEEQKKKYIPKLASGEWLGAFALTEPNAGSDAGSIRTQAERQGDYYILNGSKIFITNAGAADTYITFARTNSSLGSKGISAFVVEKDTPGFQIGKKEKKMGLHGSNTCELILDQVHIPVSQRLGDEGEGFAIAKSNLDGGRIGIGAQALGIAQAALDYAKMHLKNRTSSIDLQVKKSKIVDMTAQVEAARMLIYRAALLREKGVPCTREASMAKMFASDTAMSITTEAIQLLGTDGYTADHPLERFYRDAKVTQIYEGTNEIHRIVISNQLLKK